MNDYTPINERGILRDEISGHPIGSGYYQSTISVGEAGELADVILNSDWLATVKAEAWDEGYGLGIEVGHRRDDHWEPNPYRPSSSP